MVKKFTGSDTGKSGLRVQEDDGVPNVYGVTDISVSDTTPVSYTHLTLPTKRIV